MEESSRRSFLLAALAFALGGCAGGYFHGGEEHILSVPKPSVVRKSKPKKPALSLTKKDPVYAGAKEEWAPNLIPMPRALWAPGPPIQSRMTPMGRVTRITVHHEGAVSPNHHTEIVDVVADLNDIRTVHMRKMSAGDIGYHYIIDRAGRIWTGRPAIYRGAHSGGEANRGNLGIMLLGNFDNQKPTKRQHRALAEFLVQQMQRYRVPVSRVFTHRELRPTRCPGRALQAFMNAVRAKLRP
ncbi:MAG: peptidoglycan recognition protein family protein [Planctomycetota bacterium]|jgi:hypothetical protein